MLVRSWSFLSVLLESWPAKVMLIWLAMAASFVHERLHVHELEFPFEVVGTLGTALAIFLGFRNTSAYDRWWEARKLWGLLVNYSRSMCREFLVYISDDAFINGERVVLSSDDLAVLREERRQLVYLQLSFVHALRLQLRKAPPERFERYIKPYLNEQDWDLIKGAANPSNVIVQLMAHRVQDLYQRGHLDIMLLQRMESCFVELSNIQGGCERIKNTPFPRYYDEAPKAMMWLHHFLLPLALIKSLGYFTVLCSFPVSMSFFLLDWVGRRTENPFENQPEDVPLSALCRTIEISLREQLGEHSLPAALEPVDGILM